MPSNIMVSSSGNATLIDFGLSSKFLDKKGNHISFEDKIPEFKGNMMFASYDQMNKFKTSRRDDMVSLCYLMLYLLNND